MSRRGFKLESTNTEMAQVVEEALLLWLSQEADHPLADEVQEHIKMIQRVRLLAEADEKVTKH